VYGATPSGMKREWYVSFSLDARSRAASDRVLQFSEENWNIHEVGISSIIACNLSSFEVFLAYTVSCSWLPIAYKYGPYLCFNLKYALFFFKNIILYYTKVFSTILCLLYTYKPTSWIPLSVKKTASKSGGYF
jgi:magnesium-transporting ATPase (P-type)